ncbi:hypothetical protein [Gordonia aichiensis]|uniref:hypothetical protein n=1 Tax=Gordonia aichiensis TaxID=36820 RepID=UPI00326495A2
MAVDVPTTYRSEWSLFADWCAAFERESLPADPRTVARFLMEENPSASRSVLRRRVAAINNVHRGAGYDEPGTVTAVRRLLSARRRDVELAHDRVRELPTSGWPAGLFGRRDALILWLVVIVGVPASKVGELRCGDITMTDDQMIQIGGGHDIELPADPGDPFGLLPVWRRWAQLRNILAVRPSSASVVKPLTSAAPVSYDARPSLAAPPYPPRPDYVLLPAFDQWGNLLAPPTDDETGMTGRAVFDVVTMHLYGGGRGGRSREAWVQRILDRTKPPEPAPPVEELKTPRLADNYGHGIDARKAAVDDAFDGIDDVYADIDQRTADLLARTEKLLAEFGA